jgi:hypothetical protein
MMQQRKAGIQIKRPPDGYGAPAATGTPTAQRPSSGFAPIATGATPFAANCRSA